MDIPGAKPRASPSSSAGGSPQQHHQQRGNSSSYRESQLAPLNTIEHFASSYTRAQSFLQIEAPDHVRQRTFFDAQGSPLTVSSYINQSAFYEDEDEDGYMPDEESLVGEENHHYYRPHTASRFLSRSGSEASETSHLLSTTSGDHGHRSHIGEASDEVFSSSYKSSSTIPSVFQTRQIYGSMRGRRVSSWTAQPEEGTVLSEDVALAAGTENDPVIVQKIQDDEGNVVVVVAGQSTAPQTVFNSVNVLIGVGLLSLPLGFRYSGWILGVLLMSFTAGSTFYTAKILAKCLDTDHTLVTYADVAYAAFGSRARVLVSLLFTLELMGAGVSLVVLFSDSLNALFPSISQFAFKLIAFCILTPPCFLPLRILSFSSILGIIATFSLVFIVLFDGFYKAESPGSLLQPMATWLWPQDWKSFPLAIGIFMAPWGGHAVFPNIYRDMRHPAKYTSCLVSTYQITFLVDISMGVLGYLMFGHLVQDEITKNLLTQPGYPVHLRAIVTALIALVPLAKTPLNARPIVSTLDILFGLDSVPWTFSKHLFWPRVFKFAIRIFVVMCFVVMAIMFPQFDRIIAFFGSLLCVTICVILPVSFYLKIYSGKIPRYELIADYILLAIFTALAAVGTAWCFI